MEEEIDLRAYVVLLLRHWKWVLGLAVVAAITAFVVSSLLPPTYEAASVVAFVPPRYQFQFDARQDSASRWNPEFQTFATLATSDAILQSVVDGYRPSPEAALADWKLEVLANIVEARSEGTSGLVALRVRSRSPSDGAAIANLWADTLAHRVKEIYGGSEQDVAFLQEQVTMGKQALDAADADLVDFGARDQTEIIKVQLESLRQAQTDYLSAQRSIASMIQDIRGLRDQLAEQPGSKPSSLADNLTALLLQIKAFDAQADAQIGLQIDANVGTLSDRSLAEQIAFLDELVATLRHKSAEIEEQLADLEPQVLVLQRELQATTAEHDHLVRAQELARDKYLALARTLGEARIAAQEYGGLLQVISYAALPQTPVGPRRLFNTAVAGMLGLMMGGIVVLSLSFWRREEEYKETRRGNGESSEGREWEHDEPSPHTPHS